MVMTTMIPTANTGRATRKMAASPAWIRNAITTDKISMTGQRTAIRMIIIKDIWMRETSVVRRVTIEAEENLSILEKENSCTL